MKELLNLSIAHDIYIIGTEECQRSIAASFLVNSKTIWEDILAQVLGPTFSKLCSDTLMATHLIIFVNNELIPIISSTYIELHYRN